MLELSLRQGLAVLVVLVILHKLSLAVKYRVLARRWDTKECLKLKLWWPQRLRQMRQATANGSFAEWNARQFECHGTNTLQGNLLAYTVFATCEPANLKATMATDFARWSIGHRRLGLGPLLGNGIFVASGSLWEHSRRILRPQFSREQISQVPMIEPHVLRFAQMISEHRGRVLDLQAMFHKLTMDTATEFLFGESVGSLDFESDDLAKSGDFQRKRRFDHAILFIQEFSFLRLISLGYGWVFDSLRYRRAIRTVHEYTMDVVNKAIEESENNSEKGLLRYTFIYELLQQTRDPRVLRDETLLIMLAGRSTTASLLGSTFFELSRNPRVWSKLRSEVIAEFGSGESAAEIEGITFEKLNRCTYLRYVIQETLRMYPPVSQNLRRATADTKLPLGGGSDGQSPILVRKGDIAALNVYAMHRRKDIYGADADEFRPERWSDLTRIGWAYMPFGTGPRICLGQKYALTEASYVVVRLAQMFPHLEAGPGAYPPRMRLTVLMSFKDGVNVSLY